MGRLQKGGQVWGSSAQGYKWEIVVNCKHSAKSSPVRGGSKAPDHADITHLSFTSSYESFAVGQFYAPRGRLQYGKNNSEWKKADIVDSNQNLTNST